MPDDIPPPKPARMRGTDARPRLNLVWIAPLIALGVGGYLAVTTLTERGPEVDITFNSSGGVKVGTKVEHKAVELGSVTAVGLSDDLGHVDVHVRMQATAAPFLTDKAQFWVARLQLSGGSVSGIDSLVSGTYIEMDPGKRGGARRTQFSGLENPPGVRSDQPGTTFGLIAPEVNGLSSGTGVFYRDVLVGEVLENHAVEGNEPVRAEVFVRKPFDDRVRTGTVFWRTKGVETTVSGRGLHIEVTSLSAAVGGGISFSTPPDAPDYAGAPGGTTFRLFDDEPTATRASYNERIPCVLYVETSAAGLSPGSQVLLQGQQVGDVTGVQLAGSDAAGHLRVRVTLEILPQTLHVVGFAGSAVGLGHRLVEGGLQGKLDTVSYVTGAQAVTLAFQANPAPAHVAEDAGMVVLPTAQASASAGLSGAGGLLQSAMQVPYAEIGQSFSATLTALTARIGAVRAGKQIAPLLAMLEAARGKIRSTDASLTQTLRGLPATADRLQGLLVQANRALGHADESYGTGSSLSGEIERALAKYYDTARYTRLLADRLDRHPESIARGTTGQASER